MGHVGVCFLRILLIWAEICESENIITALSYPALQTLSAINLHANL